MIFCIDGIKRQLAPAAYIETGVYFIQLQKEGSTQTISIQLYKDCRLKKQMIPHASLSLLYIEGLCRLRSKSPFESRI